MSENRNRNSGSLLDPFLATGGVIPYGAGLGVLTAHPAADGRYVAYYGSDGKPVKFSSLVLEAIKNAGMRLEEVPRQAQQIGPGQPGYAPHRVHLLGNRPVIDAANELKALDGRRVSNLKMGLTGPGLSKNMQPIPNGKGSVQVDLDYRRWDPWSGNTHYADEMKGRNAISGSDQARQAARLGELIAARKALTKNARYVGRALQAGGPAFQLGGALLDHHLTQQEVQRELAQGNTYGAGLTNARLVGRQTGGVLGGAAVGAMLLGGAGAAGGTTVAPGPGTVLLGTAGVLGGGLFGAIVGEEAMRRLYARWMGHASDGSRTLGTPASQPTNDSFYPASGPAP
jgi:hypothetical protein